MSNLDWIILLQRTKLGQQTTLKWGPWTGWPACTSFPHAGSCALIM